MHIQHHVSLKPFNTFGLDVITDEFTELHSLADMQQFCSYIQSSGKSFLILGGGSNVLLTQDVKGITAKICTQGIQFEQVKEHTYRVIAQAGEIWHHVVLQTIEKGLYGLENMSLIPGSVGAAPMQNIGAYGVEIKDHFEYLDALEIKTGKIIRFSGEECHFGYRESVFKHAYKNQFIILTVSFLLSDIPQTKTSYGAISEQLIRMGITQPDNRSVSDAVIAIRRSKLPDPAVLGNSGSFFKNPEISISQYAALKEKYTEMPGFKTEDRMKVPAAWLIEQCGWKGKKIGHTGSHSQQALVLVNYGEANGSEIFQLAKDIQQSVQDRFGIRIEMEVNIL